MFTKQMGRIWTSNPRVYDLQKPIVATNVDALSYLIQNEQNGLLVSVDNQEEAANAISKIRNNDEFRKKLSKRDIKMCLKNMM